MHRVCGGCSSEWGFSEGSQPFGIFRPVSLVVTDEVRVEPFGVHVWSNEACDSVFIDTEVKNYGASAATFSLVNKLNDADGKTFLRLTEKVTLAPGETRILHQQQAVGKPHRWSPDDPYLYTLATMIKRSGATTDLTNTAFGFRTLSAPDADKGRLSGTVPHQWQAVLHQWHMRLRASLRTESCLLA